MDTPCADNGRAERPASGLKGLIVALLLGCAILATLAACGNEDLIFPGAFAPTFTPGNTATPVFTPTELP